MEEALSAVNASSAHRHRQHRPSSASSSSTNANSGNASIPQQSSVSSQASQSSQLPPITDQIAKFGQSLSSSLFNPTKTMTQSIGPHLRNRPSLQRRMLSAAAPSELLRTAVGAQLPGVLTDEMLRDIPDASDNEYSLFAGYKATTDDSKALVRKKSHSRKNETELQRLVREREQILHTLYTMGVRKTIASSEIREIDVKIQALQTLRAEVLERLGNLEQTQGEMELQLEEIEIKIGDERDNVSNDAYADKTPDDFMSESIHGKLSAHQQQQRNLLSSTSSSSSDLPSKVKQSSNNTSSKIKRRINTRRKSMPILHEHFEPGSKIRSIGGHFEAVTSVDFDIPFGTLVSASENDDSIRVHDLSTGIILGTLQGHNGSIKCLQMDDNLVVSGGVDASIRVWDLSRVSTEHASNTSSSSPIQVALSNEFAFEDEEDGIATPRTDSSYVHASNDGGDVPIIVPNLEGCCVHTLTAHVEEITALHIHKDTLVSGSADKTLRQWDLNSGRCIQTLDVMWAVSSGSKDSWATSSIVNSSAQSDFIGALQCFDAALASGTADGIVRLWDLRSGQVHRSLVGHTGPVSCLQFDEVHLVTGSHDRSIRIWDLRTGGLFDAFAYDNPITSLHFDSRRIVSAAGESAVKVFDRLDSRHWECGANDGGIVTKVRCKEGYLVEGRQNGIINTWAC